MGNFTVIEPATDDEIVACTTMQIVVAATADQKVISGTGTKKLSLPDPSKTSLPFTVFTKVIPFILDLAPALRLVGSLLWVHNARVILNPK